MTIDLEPQYLTEVRRLLDRHLHSPVKVWLFGSRATGRAKKYSDIDLALEANDLLPPATLIDLAADFDECRIPYKVDLVDLASVEPAFKEIICRDRILLHEIFKACP